LIYVLSSAYDVSRDAMSIFLGRAFRQSFVLPLTTFATRHSVPR